MPQQRKTTVDALRRVLVGLLSPANEALVVLDELVDEMEDSKGYKLQRPIEERLRKAIKRAERLLSPQTRPKRKRRRN